MSPLLFLEEKKQKNFTTIHLHRESDKQAMYRRKRLDGLFVAKGSLKSFMPLAFSA